MRRIAPELPCLPVGDVAGVRAHAGGAAAASTAASLAGQVALVTGASRGIGRADRRRLAGAGARVVVNYRSNEAAAAGLRRRDRGGRAARAELVPFDVADARGRARGDQRARASVATRLDILVNNAGIAIDGLVLRFKDEDWQRILAANLSGVFHCSKAAARAMMRARYGRIVNLTSVVGAMGNAGQAAYAAAKAGVVGFTRALAREVASRGITVNAVAPGFVETEMTAALPEATRDGLPRARSRSAGSAPSEEVAAAVAFLAAPAAGYVTGQVLA